MVRAPSWAGSRNAASFLIFRYWTGSTRPTVCCHAKSSRSIRTRISTPVPKTRSSKTPLLPATRRCNAITRKRVIAGHVPSANNALRSRFRCLSVSVDEGIRQQTKALQATEPFQQSRRLRKKVEMLFAHMKQQFRFTRLRLRGLNGASEECLLMATVQNLRRLVRPAMQTAERSAATRRQDYRRPRELALPTAS